MQILCDEETKFISINCDWMTTYLVSACQSSNAFPARNCRRGGGKPGKIEGPSWGLSNFEGRLIMNPLSLIFPAIKKLYCKAVKLEHGGIEVIMCFDEGLCSRYTVDFVASFLRI